MEVLIKFIVLALTGNIIDTPHGCLFNLKSHKRLITENVGATNAVLNSQDKQIDMQSSKFEVVLI